ncbi:Thioredoxin [Tritrichomonas foetus]|uniref:Thioredoxin n=1 Tax=Tritrichomonas foetus TaxID=1144522 RepID=A0A1J4KP97_9EUKA|nr:Thioredoxin [Tritrichomonas foetus]|eukprot:OHT13121.1 Thioredoxin [Tritrichomonas foetus]
MSASNILVFKGDKEALTQQVISAGGLVVVDFHASWCPSCRKLAQSLPKIANEYPNVLFLKSDVDEAKDLAAAFSISSIPHCKFFKVGDDKQLNELGSVTGANNTQIYQKLKDFA